MPDILLTHPQEFRDLKFGSQALRALARQGSVVLNETNDLLSLEELIRKARGCRVIVADRLTPGTKELFSALPDLLAFVRNAVDIRNIDITAASDRGILVTQAGAHFVDALVELIVAQMVDLARDCSNHVNSYRAGHEPAPRMGVQLAGKKAGIIGMGRVGQRLAEVLRCLRLDVVASDPRPDPSSDVPRITLDQLLVQSDFVVCLALHTPDTQHLCDASFFARMRRDAWFLNASRGALVDEEALYAALTEGGIRGAALDVGTDTDDQPCRRLARLPNVVASPHLGGMVIENILGQAMDSVRQAGDILQGRLPEHALNAGAAHRLGRSS